jgi:H+/Cl- antiporter ClcA
MLSRYGPCNQSDTREWQPWYQGFDNVNSILGAEGSIFRSPYPPALLLELVVVKLSATSLCRQSGLVGGVYAPSLFMGAALGSAYGAALVPLALAGAPVAPPQAYALVGMAGVLAGICRVPLTVGLSLTAILHRVLTCNIAPRFDCNVAPRVDCKIT